MRLLQFITFSSVILLAAGFQCYNGYNSDMAPKDCEPVENWCVKYTNKSVTYRGCTDVNGLCKNEEVGCYPEKVTGPDQGWCCCNKDLCNGSQITGNFISIFTVMVMLYHSII